MGEVYTFIVNGQKIETSEEKNLLDFLRDNLGLISVKNGCKEGACGTCTVLIDGKAMKSCIFTTKKIDGKEIKNKNPLWYLSYSQWIILSCFVYLTILTTPTSPISPASS